MMAFDRERLPVRNKHEMANWISNCEQERIGWDVPTAINFLGMAMDHDNNVMEWYHPVLATYMRGFPNDYDFWEAVCTRHWYYAIDWVLVSCFPDWLRNCSELWLELLTRNQCNTHLAVHTGDALCQSSTFVEALLNRRPEAVTFLPEEAYDHHYVLVMGVVDDWTRAREALRCLYCGRNYESLFERILAAHGANPDLWSALARVTWKEYETRIILHQEQTGLTGYGAQVEADDEVVDGGIVVEVEDDEVTETDVEAADETVEAVRANEEDEENDDDDSDDNDSLFDDSDTETQEMTVVTVDPTETQLRLCVAELETLVGRLGDLYGAQQARVQELQEQIQGFDQRVTVLTHQRDRLDNRLRMQGHHIYRLERQLQQAEDHGPRGWYGQPNQPNPRRRRED
jgi:hypothetical protein